MAIHWLSSTGWMASGQSPREMAAVAHDIQGRLQLRGGENLPQQATQHD
jgi:hypothetical protein